MQDIPCGLTPAELPAREQSHEQNSDFATTINIFSGRQLEKGKNFFHRWTHRSLCTGLMPGSSKNTRLA
jgi:hypothetical protein